MNIKKSMITIIIVVAIANIFNIAITHASEKIIVYVSTGCPHCANVEAFVEYNKLEESVEFRDTAEDENYDIELTALFDKYDIPANERGVPSAEIDGELFSGDTPIINEFVTKFMVEEPVYSAPLGTSDYVFIGFGGLLLLFIIGYSIYSSVIRGK